MSFDYCTDDYFDTYADYDQETAEQVWTVANGPTTFSADVTGLINSTEYHFRAKLRYGVAFVYGLDDTFTTDMLSPDSIPTIQYLAAYKDLLEPDDCLFVLMADIPYKTLPGIPVNRAFIWSLFYTGTEIGWNVGYAMNDLGYGLNIYGLYFPASASIDWGNNDDFYFQLAGSGAVFFTSPPVYDATDDPSYSVTADTWITTTDYNARLAEDLLSLTSTLEQDWQTVLLDEQDTKTVLSSNGEKLLRNAIPGVQSMAPAIFYVQNADIDVDARAWGTSLDTTYQERLLGPDGLPGGGDDPWHTAGLVGVADWLNIPWLLFMGIICIGICVFVIYKSVQKCGTAIPGYVGSLLVVLCFGLLVLGLTVVAIIAFILVLAGGWLVFMRKA